MKINLAAHLGMCFGVRDAIQLALTHNLARPITVLGALVHNPTVLESLTAQGIALEDNLNNVKTHDVLITAHGASDRQIQRVRASGHNVIEATCPLVHYAHRCVKLLVAQGYHPIIIGQRDHVEVRGLTEDLTAYDVVLTEEDIEHLTVRERFGVAAQTTQPIERVRHLVACLRRRFPFAPVEFRDTVCQPTRQRQRAAVDLAQNSDVVIVIGGSNSNNTRELVQTCSEYCQRVFHVRDDRDLRSVWFKEDDRVGITAGTSTPDQTIQRVVHWLEEFDAFQQRLVAAQPQNVL